MGKKFDICIMNPPYGNGLHEKFLEKSLNICNKVCSVQPTSWVMGKKKNKKISNALNTLDNDTNIEIILGASYFDACILAQLSINFIDFTKKGAIKLTSVTGETTTYDDINDIHVYSTDKYLTDFNEHVKDAYKKDSLQDHLLKAYKLNDEELSAIEKEKLYIVRINGIRGHVNQDTGLKHNDFYTLVSNSQKEIKEKVLLNSVDIKKKDKKGKQIVNLCYKFDTDLIRNNFFNYIKTDFVRSCFMLVKTNIHFDTGELKYVPWQDFSDEVFSKSPSEIDNYLFDKYKISDEIRKHIEEILPDYYGIRK